MSEKRVRRPFLFGCPKSGRDTVFDRGIGQVHGHPAFGREAIPCMDDHVIELQQDVAFVLASVLHGRPRALRRLIFFHEQLQIVLD
jgi:hypothetical protein